MDALWNYCSLAISWVDDLADSSHMIEDLPGHMIHPDLPYRPLLCCTTRSIAQLGMTSEFQHHRAEIRGTCQLYVLEVLVHNACRTALMSTAGAAPCIMYQPRTHHVLTLKVVDAHIGSLKCKNHEWYSNNIFVGRWSYIKLVSLRNCSYRQTQARIDTAWHFSLIFRGTLPWCSLPLLHP